MFYNSTTTSKKKLMLRDVSWWCGSTNFQRYYLLDNNSFKTTLNRMNIRRCLRKTLKFFLCTIHSKDVAWIFFIFILITIPGKFWNIFENIMPYFLKQIYTCRFSQKSSYEKFWKHFVETNLSWLSNKKREQLRLNRKYKGILLCPSFEIQNYPNPIK